MRRRVSHNGQRHRIVAVLLLCTFFGIQWVSAGPLVDSGQVLPGVWASAVAWGDYDGDGDSDLAIVGETDEGQKIARIYRNAGGILTHDTAQILTSVYFGAVVWGDCDNDGDLDLALSGWDERGDEILKLYRNSLGVLSEDRTQIDLIGVRYSTMAWGDYDGDGDLDLVVSGMDLHGNALTMLYRNEEGLFEIDEENSDALVNLNKSAMAWGDYDNDGDLDLALSGLNVNGGKTTRVYKNDPTGTLTWDSTIELEQVSGGGIAWGDYDRDGDQDLALSGWDANWGGRLIVYKNKPTGVLNRDRFLSLPQMVGPMAWGDWDNDGDPDLIVAGQNSFSDLFSVLLVNTPEAGLDETQQLEQLRRGAGAWGDFDGDGDLDLVISGEGEDARRKTVLYRNEESRENTPPLAPARLNSPVVTSGKITFRWEPGEDSETESGDLTHNLRIGTEPGGNNVFSGAIPVGPGNVGTKTSKILRAELPQDTYYWSVQAVDSGFRRSLWSQEDILLIQKFVSSDQDLADLKMSAMAWGDYDNDGDPDLVLCGVDIDGETKSLLYDSVEGLLRLNRSIELVGVQEGDVAWGDYDNDGDLDLVITGADRFGNRYGLLYKNDPTGVLALDETQSQKLPGVRWSSTAWGDYDNDGNLDLVVIGRDTGNRLTTMLFKNTGKGNLEDAGQDLVNAGNGEVAWGDYDSDGDLDLALSGEVTGAFVLKIYKNDPTGTLKEDTSLSSVGLAASSVAWGDYDNDGDLDLAAAGFTASNTAVTMIYENDPPGALTLSSSALTGIVAGGLAWGDYDNEGDLDLAVIGNDVQGQIIKIYRNDNGTFNEDPFKLLKEMDFGAVSWVDVDGDGDLDLATSGQRGPADAFAPYSAVNDNLESRFNPNRRPDPPAALTASTEGDRVLLRWDEGGDPNGTPSIGLTYNLKVGTVPGGNDIHSGVVSIGFGSIGQGTSHRLSELASGQYYWTVQAVDNGLARSEWSREGGFIVDTVKPVVSEVRIDPQVVGIGQDVTVVVRFLDEHSGLDTKVPPVATFGIGGGPPIILRTLDYRGDTWTGKATISHEVPSGTATVSVAQAVDAKGNIMETAEGAGSFGVDTESPRVSHTEPAPDQVGVPRSSAIRATFSESMDVRSMGPEVFKLRLGQGEIEGSFNYDVGKRTILFTPLTELIPSTEYEAFVSSGVRDSVRNRMESDFRWLFKTADVVSAKGGGVIQNESETVMLYFPPNALDADQEVTIETVSEPSLPQGLSLVGSVHRFEPVVPLNKASTIRIRYLAPEMGGMEPGKFAIYQQQESDLSWERIGGTARAGEIATVVRSLGTFALFEDLAAPEGSEGVSELTCQPRVLRPVAGAPKAAGAFRAETDVSFRLGASSEVTIRIYNESGRLERVLARDKPMNAGLNAEPWDGKDDDKELVSSGLYIVVITAGDHQEQITVAVLHQ